MEDNLLTDEDNSSGSTDSNIEDTPRYTLKATAELPLLPEDCLYNIFKFLGPIDLHNVSRLCQRFSSLADDKKHWKRIDFRPHILTTNKLRAFLKHFKKSTKFLAIRGCVIKLTSTDWKGLPVLTPDLLMGIQGRCPELETLILEEHFADASEFSLDSLPSMLKYLSLKGSVLTNIEPERPYFHGLHTYFPNLWALILTNCVWIVHHDLMSLCKCKNLTVLHLDGCLQLGGYVAYTSLATRFGFQSIKLLDLRNTGMGDSDVTCFTHSRTLTHLYLECPTYHRNKEVLTDTPATVEFDPNDEFIHIHSQSSRLGNKLYEQTKMKGCIGMRNDKHGVYSQASTSDGIINSAGPSSVSERCRKRRLQDSDSSSVESDSSSDESDSSSDESDVLTRPVVKTKCDLQRCYKKLIMSEGNCNIPSKPHYNGILSDDSSLCGDVSSNENKDSEDVPLKREIIQGDSLFSNFAFKSEHKDRKSVKSVTNFCDLSPDNSHEHSDVQAVSDSSKSRAGKFSTYRLPHTEQESDSIVTDVTTLAFSNRGNEDGNFVRISAGEFSNIRPELHTLVLRGYTGITDTTLNYLVGMTSLRYLDVSGTSVTEKAVMNFHINRPEVFVRSDFREKPFSLGMALLGTCKRS